MRWVATIRRFFVRRRLLIRVAAAALAWTAVTAMPVPAQAGVFVAIRIAPPPLPVYAQPMIPGPGYIWTPGYWAWDGNGYYWVPGIWVLAPFVGALWTPGYWGWSGGTYLFHTGYWGTRVGFYGGINYGYGYGGHGYDGGYWRGRGFYYNRSVNHVSSRITNVYNRTVVNRTTVINRTSFNGGPRGVAARATAQQQASARNQHFGPVAAQRQQSERASRTPSRRAGAFGSGTSAARGAPTAANARATRYTPQATSAPQQPGALRSAGYAPHGNGASRQRASERGYASSSPRNEARANGHRPESAGMPSRYQPAGASRGYAAPRTETPAYRQAARPAAPYAAAPHAQGAAAGKRGNERGNRHD